MLETTPKLIGNPASDKEWNYQLKLQPPEERIVYYSISARVIPESRDIEVSSFVLFTQGARPNTQVERTFLSNQRAEADQFMKEKLVAYI